MNYKEVKLATMNPEQVANEIGDFIVGEITRIGYTGAVIGLSGGVDSTTTAALTKRAFDKYNGLRESFDRAYDPKRNIELIGYMLPSKVNANEDTIDGEKVAKRLGIRYQTISIEPWVEVGRITNPEAFVNKTDTGNLMSRIRANILNTKAATEKKLVLGTGNRDEDFGVGYYTLFGDGAVHLSPIGALPKRLVRQMACYLGFEDLANRIPTAGLEPGQTDFKDLGYSYDFVELFSEGILQGLSVKELRSHPKILKAGRKEMQNYQNNFGKSKFENLDCLINDILKKRQVAEVKSKIVSPPIAQVTLTYKAVTK